MIGPDEMVDVVSSTAARLRAAGCVDADDEAALFVDAAPDPATLEAWIRRREQGEPPAWIIGAVWFCGHHIAVEHGVYVPRPHTEALARRASSALRAVAADQRIAADLCTGSGALAVHVQRAVAGSTVVGVDIDPGAVRCARRNGVPAVIGYLGDPLRSRHFTVVTAVVPYVPTGHLRFLPADVRAHESVSALDGGPDGLRVAREAVASAARLLRPGGFLFLELGGEQVADLRSHLAAHGFDEIEPWFDVDDDLRGMAARRHGGGSMVTTTHSIRMR